MRPLQGTELGIHKSIGYHTDWQQATAALGLAEGKHSYSRISNKQKELYKPSSRDKKSTRTGNWEHVHVLELAAGYRAVHQLTARNKAVCI
jgi:hypothetical protein